MQLSTYGQEKSVAVQDTTTNIIDRWVKGVTNAIPGFGIRKSYDATSKDEGKPANFMWNNDFQNGQDYLVVDMGLKVIDWTILRGDLLLTPKFEWHRDDTQEEGKKKNTIGAGINYEYMPLVPGDKELHIVPFLLGSTEYKYDEVKELEILNYKIFLSAIGDKKGTPNFQPRNEEKNIFEYNVMSGFEYYQSLNSDHLHCAVWASRIYAELSPIPSLYSYFQLTADYTIRFVTSDNLYNQGNMEWLSVAANVYFNKKQNIGAGLEYSYGEDPLTNFAKTDKISFAIKIKI